MPFSYSKTVAGNVHSEEERLRMAFVDLKKAFDIVPRRRSGGRLRSFNVEEWLVSVII